MCCSFARKYNITCLCDWLKAWNDCWWTACLYRDNNLCNKYLNSAVFTVFLVDYKSSKLMDLLKLIFWWLVNFNNFNQYQSYYIKMSVCKSFTTCYFSSSTRTWKCMFRNDNHRWLGPVHTSQGQKACWVGVCLCVDVAGNMDLRAGWLYQQYHTATSMSHSLPHNKHTSHNVLTL